MFGRYAWASEPWGYIQVATAAPGAMTGTSSVAFTTTAILKGEGALAGSTAPTFTTAGILRGSAPLSGSVSVTYTTQGILKGTGSLQGSASPAFTAQGAIGGIWSSIYNTGHFTRFWRSTGGNKRRFRHTRHIGGYWFACWIINGSIHGKWHTGIACCSRRNVGQCNNNIHRIAYI